MGSEEMVRLLRRLALRARRRRETPEVSTAPGCAFGAVVEARLQHLEKDLGEVKVRLTGLFLAVLGAIIDQVIRRVF